MKTWDIPSELWMVERVQTEKPERFQTYFLQLSSDLPFGKPEQELHFQTAINLLIFAHKNSFEEIEEAMNDANSTAYDHLIKQPRGIILFLYLVIRDFREQSQLEQSENELISKIESQLEKLYILNETIWGYMTKRTKICLQITTLFQDTQVVLNTYKHKISTDEEVHKLFHSMYLCLKIIQTRLSGLSSKLSRMVNTLINPEETIQPALNFIFDTLNNNLDQGEAVDPQTSKTVYASYCTILTSDSSLLDKLDQLIDTIENHENIVESTQTIHSCNNLLESLNQEGKSTLEILDSEQVNLQTYLDNVHEKVREKWNSNISKHENMHNSWKNQIKKRIGYHSFHKEDMALKATLKGMVKRHTNRLVTELGTQYNKHVCEAYLTSSSKQLAQLQKEIQTIKPHIAEYREITLRLERTQEANSASSTPFEKLDLLIIKHHKFFIKLFDLFESLSDRFKTKTAERLRSRLEYKKQLNELEETLSTISAESKKLIHNIKEAVLHHPPNGCSKAVIKELAFFAPEMGSNRSQTVTIHTAPVA